MNKQEMINKIYEVIIPYDNYETYIWGDYISKKVCRLSNVLEYGIKREKWFKKNAFILTVIEKWKLLHEILEHQSEECITYIYNLIMKHVPKKENSN